MFTFTSRRLHRSAESFGEMLDGESPMSVGSVLRSAWVVFVMVLSALSVKGQCLDGNSFVVCPSIDAIYLLNKNSLGAVNLSDGTVKWQVVLPHETDEAYLGPVRSDNALVLFAGTPLTRAYAFDPESGRLIWRKEASSDEWIGAGPYILFGDRQHWEAVTALDDRTGQEIWHHSGRNPGTVNFADLSGRVVLTNLFALDAYTGEVLKRWPGQWQVSAATFAGRYVAIGTETGGPSHAKLAVYSLPSFQLLWTRREHPGATKDSRERNIAEITGDAEHLLVASSGGGMESPGRLRLEWISIVSGKTLWSREIAGLGIQFLAPIALNQRLAIVATENLDKSGTVQALDRETGALKWTIRVAGQLTSGLVCEREACYAGSVSGEVLRLDVVSKAQTWYGLPRQ